MRPQRRRRKVLADDPAAQSFQRRFFPTPRDEKHDSFRLQDRADAHGDGVGRDGGAGEEFGVGFARGLGQLHDARVCAPRRGNSVSLL